MKFPKALSLLLVMSFVVASCGGHGAKPTPTEAPQRPMATLPPLQQPSPAFSPVGSPTAVATATASTQPTAVAPKQTAASANAPSTPTPKAATPSPEPTQGAKIPFGDIMSSPDYGIHAFLWWRPEIADRDLGLIKDAGFTWVKQWFAWKDIEGAGKGIFDWSHSDRVVKQVHDQFRLKLLARTDGYPKWAGPPPEDAQDYADFVYALANRYKGKIQAYQIWNEPNLAREWGGHRPDPAGYARMLRLAYAAIKKADPNAIVISAGMAPTGTNDNTAMPDDLFIEKMYKAMGSSNGYFDMLGVHAAGYKAPPELAPAAAASNKALYGGERFFCFRHVEDLRKIMVKEGDAGKRVAILEFGWTSDPIHPAYKWHAVTEQQKAEYIVRAFKWAKKHWTPWIGVMTLIYMPDVDWTKQDEQYWWAITRPMKIDEWKLLPAYIEVCKYLNSERGLGKCPWASRN